MCIIACKPFGVDSFDWTNAENCFSNNPDGAGFAFVVQGDTAVRYRKGFMNFKAFQSALKSVVLDRYNLTDIQLLLHYRITTHGGTRAENTHPFPVSANPDKIVSLKGRCDTVCAMNGITDIDIPKGSTFSDTMQYVKDVLAFPHSLRPDFFKSKAFPDFIGRSGAKWAFMDKYSLLTFGDFNEDNGWLYSNFSYQYNSAWYYQPTSYSRSHNYTAWGAPCDSADVYNHIEFEGIAITSKGEYLEYGTEDEVYIGTDDNLYHYDYTSDTLYKILDITHIYDSEYKHTNYDLMYEHMYGGTYV